MDLRIECFTCVISKVPYSLASYLVFNNPNTLLFLSSLIFFLDLSCFRIISPRSLPGQLLRGIQCWPALIQTNFGLFQCCSLPRNLRTALIQLWLALKTKKSGSKSQRWSSLFQRWVSLKKIWFLLEQHWFRLRRRWTALIFDRIRKTNFIFFQFFKVFRSTSLGGGGTEIGVWAQFSSTSEQNLFSGSIFGRAFGTANLNLSELFVTAQVTKLMRFKFWKFVPRSVRWIFKTKWETLIFC